jgi:hypothetical protein
MFTQSQTHCIRDFLFWILARCEFVCIWKTICHESQTCESLQAINNVVYFANAWPQSLYYFQFPPISGSKCYNLTSLTPPKFTLHIRTCTQLLSVIKRNLASEILQPATQCIKRLLSQSMRAIGLFMSTDKEPSAWFHLHAKRYSAWSSRITEHSNTAGTGRKYRAIRKELYNFICLLRNNKSALKL